MSERDAPWERGHARSTDIAALESELESVARRVERKIDPGLAAMVAAVGVLAVVLALLLPWIDGAAGWRILVGATSFGPLPRLFTFTITAFGLVTSVLALTTRFWVLAWVSAVGCGIATINGVWAIWTRQSGALEGISGPGFGLVLGVLATVLLTFTWAKIALQRG